MAQQSTIEQTILKSKLGLAKFSGELITPFWLKSSLAINLELAIWIIAKISANAIV